MLRSCVPEKPEIRETYNTKTPRRRVCWFEKSSQWKWNHSPKTTQEIQGLQPSSVQLLHKWRSGSHWSPYDLHQTLQKHHWSQWWKPQIGKPGSLVPNQWMFFFWRYSLESRKTQMIIIFQIFPTHLFIPREARPSLHNMPSWNHADPKSPGYKDQGTLQELSW